MVQKAVKELCGVSEKLTDDLDADQLAVAKKHIDALAHPLKPDDIRALLPLLPQDGDTAAGLNWSLLHAIEAAPDWPMWDLVSVRARGVISGVGDGVFRGGACPTPECGVAGGHRVHRYGGVCTLQP